MTLFIARTFSGGTVHPNTATANLMSISNFDTGYGENSAHASGMTEVTYTRTDPGIPATRLALLVNTDFPTPAGAIDMIIVAADNTWSIEVQPGVFQPINTVVGIAFPSNDPSNTTGSQLTIYDSSECDGHGYFAFDVNGNHIASPASVILYHELSHLHDFATTNNGPSTEPDAEADENDMRDQLGLAHRDPNNHGGGCGGGVNCCIVASVSSGSSYSALVNSLRTTRDRLLRPNEVGFDLFDRLHRDYYAFSPQVVDLMGDAPPVKAIVASHFVEPLVRCLDLVRWWSESDRDPAALGEAFIHRVGQCPAVLALSADELGVARGILLQGSPFPDTPDHRLAALVRLLREKALPSELIGWAMGRPVDAFLEARQAQVSGASATDLGRLLGQRLQDWAADLPLTDVWETLSEWELGQEAEFLGRRLLREADGRARFAARFRQRLGGGPRIEAVLASAGFTGGPPMSDAGLRAVAGSFEPDPKDQAWMNLVVTLHNDADRPMHAYNEMRTFRFDDATGALELRLFDDPIPPGMPVTYMYKLPSMTAIDPHASKVLRVRVPRTASVLRRPGPGVPAGLVQMHLDQARVVQVEVAFADAPFYHDPRPTKGAPLTRERLADQLHAWGRRRAVATWARDGSDRDAPRGSGQGPGGSSGGDSTRKASGKRVRTAESA